MIIAIDGPAASGKGELGRRLARHYGLAYLDTGLLYRAVGWQLRQQGLDPEDEHAAIDVARALTSDILDEPGLRGDEAAGAASKVSAIAGVRAALLDFQRAFAGEPPGDAAGAVLDGRDIGTIVCPGADVKIFIDAAVEERAKRRHADLTAKGAGVSYDQVLADLQRRDKRDRERTVAPLAQAPDAFFLDTSALDPDQAFQAARGFIEQARADAAGG